MTEVESPDGNFLKVCVPSSWTEGLPSLSWELALTLPVVSLALTAAPGT